MMDLLLENQDLGITDGDLAVCPTDTTCIAQTIATRLKVIQGEWFLDGSLGVPYFTQIFGHKRGERFIRQLIMPEIQAVQGVREVTSFKTSEQPNRSLSISFEATLTDGTKQSFNESIGV